MSSIDYWYILRLNAEQWAIGPLDIGRRNGKMFPRIGPNLELQGFQEAVREELAEVEALPLGQYSLTIFVWRDRETYEGTSKRIRKSQVDATNIQKGLEDALQGVLFGNDRDVRDIRTVIVEQGPGVIPRIAVRASLWDGLNPDEIPMHVWERLDSQAESPQSHLWGDDEDVF